MTLGTMVQGSAVFGYDPAQVLCWKPCCRQPVRPDPAAFELWLPVVVHCDRPRCEKLWTVQSPATPSGEERVVLWRLVSQSR
jgi:hypothetical protein